MCFRVSHPPLPSSWERRRFFPPSVECLWALLGFWVDLCCVCGVPLAVWCELRSHHTRHHHKGKLCLAGLVPGSWLAYRNGHFVTAETLKRMLFSSRSQELSFNMMKVPFCELFLFESGRVGRVAQCGAGHRPALACLCSVASASSLSCHLGGAAPTYVVCAALLPASPLN